MKWFGRELKFNGINIWHEGNFNPDNKVDKVTGKGLSTEDYTTAEKNKLAGIATGAEVNQNAFSNVKVGSSTISADSKTDTLEIVAGTGVSLSADTTNNKATIAVNSAPKLTTARTISLTGDVTGSASFDGSGNISINATVVDDSHVHDSRYYTESEIQNNDISMRRLLVNTNGVPTSNLGNPTVAEMALFEEQFNNKLAFYDISKFTFEVFDGTTWTDVTSSISTTNKKRLVGGDNTASIVIPNGATKYRITIRNNGSYVYINALYMYWSSSGNSSQIHIWKKRDDGIWEQHTNSSTSVSAWPGHLYLPFATIPWSTASTSGHYNDVRIEFTPTWNNANNITLNKLQIWGGYPAGKRNIYSIDENKNVTFPASVTATTFNGDLSGKSASADKLATARTITLTGDVTGNASFDGSANITISATVADDSHNHVISNIDNLQTTLDSKAPLTSPAFTGTPTAPTAPNGTNTNQIATTAFVQNALSTGGYGDMLKSIFDTNDNNIVDRAETADKLTTPRTINGVVFDGTANITITANPNSHTHSASDLPNASTSAKGIVQLSTSVSSTSTTLAATSSAVKQAYDLANSKTKITVSTTQPSSSSIGDVWIQTNI